MLAFFVGEWPVWADVVPTASRGVAHPAPHWDEEHHPNYNLWTFTPLETDKTLLCHVSDLESVGGGLEGIYQWMVVERCAEIHARDAEPYQSPALLRRGGRTWENRTPAGTILTVKGLPRKMKGGEKP